VKAYAYWFLFLVGAIMLLTLAISGKLAIATAVAVFPDDVVIRS
jgi:hypothetical protein